MEGALAQSMAPLPASYREALERLEQSQVTRFANLQEDGAQKSGRKLVGAAGNTALLRPTASFSLTCTKREKILPAKSQRGKMKLRF